MINVLDIAGEVIGASTTGKILSDNLFRYYQKHSNLLESHLMQVSGTRGLKSIKDLSVVVAEEIENQYSQIQEYYRTIIESVNKIPKKVNTLVKNVPETIIIICVAGNGAAGWAGSCENVPAVFIAVERVMKNPDLLVAHELAHILTNDKWETILDGFYREGAACYLSSVICPGYDEHNYTFNEADVFHKYRNWIQNNCKKNAQ